MSINIRMYSDDGTPAENGQHAPVPTLVAIRRCVLLCAILEDANRLQVEVLLPELLALLPQLPSTWMNTSGSSSSETEAACRQLLAGLCRILKSSNMSLDQRASLSSTFKSVMIALIKEAFPKPQQPSCLPKRTPAYILLKLSSRSDASLLPLLPGDVTKVLHQASKLVVQPSQANGGLYAGGMKAGASAGAARADQTLPMMMGLMAAASQVLHSAHMAKEAVHAEVGRLSAIPEAEGLETLGASAAEGNVPVLMEVAQWACGVLRVAVQRLMGSPSSSGTPEQSSQQGPSAHMIRAAAHLATNACIAMVTIVPPSPTSMQQVGDVLECLLDLTEAVVVSAFSVLSSTDLSAAEQQTTVRQVLETGASILQRAPLLMRAVVLLESGRAAAAAQNGGPPTTASHAPPTSSLSTILSRFKGTLVAAAALASGPGGSSAAASTTPTADGGAAAGHGDKVAEGTGGGKGGKDAGSGAARLSGAQVDALWDWDLQSPLTGVMEMESPAGANADFGWAAQKFVRVVAEAMCAAMAAVWRQGRQRALVHALLLLPGSAVASPNERKAIALVTGRLLVLLRGDEKLSQACLPLLMDAVTMQPEAKSAKEDAGTAQQDAAMFACFTRTIAAMAVAAACKHVTTHDWAYEQITDLLIRLYRDHHTPVGTNEAGKSPSFDVRSASLALAITRMAEGMAAGAAPRNVQSDLQVRLLSLFSDLGMRVRAGGPGVVHAMGDLLPAIAACCEGMASVANVANTRGEEQHQNGGSKVSPSPSVTSSRTGLPTSRFNYDNFARTQKEDGVRIKLLRNLWLHTALHQLCTPHASPAWREASGRIARHTPLLLVGLDSGSPEDVAERLKVELGPRLARAGSAAEPANLKTLLCGTYNITEQSAYHMMPVEPAKRAHLLLIAACELARAALASLPAPGERCPLATTLAYLEVSRPGSEDSSWFEVLVRGAFERLLKNVSDARAAAVDSAKEDGGAPRVNASQAVAVAGMSGMGEGGMAESDVEARCSACVEGMAVTLIEHLGNLGSHLSGSAPQVAIVSEALLQQLLAKYPHMHWNPRCMLSLLGILETEEGDMPMGELRPKPKAKLPSVVWKNLLQWVHAAALVAPSRTEAILHQFLGQTAPVAPLTAPTAATIHATQASAAALRRAADLLATIAEARRKSGTARSSSGTSDSVLALCRKQYYSGVVLGLQHMQLDEEGSNSPESICRMPFDMAAHKVVDAMETAVNDPATPLPVVEERYMAATALLATSSCSMRDDSRSGNSLEHTEAESALLRSMVAVPLGRFSTEIMSHALFAWMWVVAANMSSIIPLTTLAANAWVETAKRGVGLFSGAPGQETNEDGNVVEGLYCHGLWLNFFDEMWDSVGDVKTPTRQQAAMREVITRMLHSSLANPFMLSSHPAAAGPRFRLLSLALRLAHSSANLAANIYRSTADGGAKAGKEDGSQGGGSHPKEWLLASLLLRDRALQAGLAWFANPPAFSAHLTLKESQEQEATVSTFANALSHLTDSMFLQEAPRMPPSAASRLLASLEGRQTTSFDEPQKEGEPVHPVWGKAHVNAKEALNLLLLLCKFEVERLQTWTNPLAVAAAQNPPSSSHSAKSGQHWEKHAQVAWQISPRLAVELAGRFPTFNGLQKEVGHLLVKGAAEPRVQALPKAALMLATPEAADAKHPALEHLSKWAPGKAVEGLQLISSGAGRNPLVKAYAARCLENTPPAEVAFYLPQLVQSLRSDHDGMMAATLLRKARENDMFAHQLIWALQTEEQPPPEAFHPEVKRSGWEPPRDFGLWKPAKELLKKVLDQMSPASRDYWDAENSYFEKVTGISGVLAKVEKDERKAAIAVELAKFSPSRADLYLPTNPDCRVINHIQTSGTPMQSAAKIPILIAFQLEQLPHLVEPNPDPTTQERGIPKQLACIFKVGDDVRQDVLALQVIRLLEDAFKSSGLPAYLCSYGCLPTGYERGIIEVVPNTKSRAGLGELSDKGLYDIFQTEFGMPGSPTFEAARHNFIASEAGYAIASFLLQAKDRHNGNLLITNEGHLVHIDFGFILEISPGGNMGFESAAFKLSHEMTQLLDPGANRSSATWAEFEELVVRAYLAARTVAEPIIATVALMAQSGLPCFSRGYPVENLRGRFHLEMSEKQAAAFMRQVVNDAYSKWTTGFYDYIQALQNRIPY